MPLPREFGGAFTAAIFVSFGALSYLLIPNPKALVIQEAKAPAVKTIAPIAGTI